MRRPLPSVAWSTRASKKVEQRAVSNLKRAIWSLDEGPALGRFDPYADHCQRLLAAIDKRTFDLNGPGATVHLVEVIKAYSRQDIETLRNSIRASSLSWPSPSTPDNALDHAIQLGAQLWLFTTPELSDDKLTLSQCVSSTLSKIRQGAKISRMTTLSSDFCEKSLTRKGGISLVWTSDLSEHLTFESKARLRVFRHASALRAFSKLGSEENSFFPPGFLWETDLTLRLLFQPNNLKNERRNRKMARRGPSDLEAGIDTSSPPLDLAQYPIWGSRLAEVQQIYDVARPGALQQWWYDRRNKPEWATFWIAIVIFLLTVIFGLISSITSIMQVYAAFRAVPT